MKLLILRPEPGASASAERAKAAGFEPVLLPLFEIAPRVWQVPDPSAYDALLITSANAIRHAGPGLQILSALPVCAVGERSAAAASAVGLSVAVTGTSDADEAITAAAKAGYHRLLWLAGEEHKQPSVPDAVTLDTIICYAAEELPLPNNAADIIGSADIAALHSPRAAHRFADIVAGLGLDKSAITIAAFSPAIAEAAGMGWRDVTVADGPSDSALLSAVAQLVKHGVQEVTEKEQK